MVRWIDNCLCALLLVGTYDKIVCRKSLFERIAFYDHIPNTFMAMFRAKLQYLHPNYVNL